MLYVCVRGVMDVVFSVCIVTRGSVGVGSMSVSSCRCCMFVSCVYPVSLHSAAFCMTYSLLMLVEDARGDHMEEAGLMTALYVAMSVSFCLSHPVAVSAFSICNGWCTCTEML